MPIICFSGLATSERAERGSRRKAGKKDGGRWRKKKAKPTILPDLPRWKLKPIGAVGPPQVPRLHFVPRPAGDALVEDHVAFARREGGVVDAGCTRRRREREEARAEAAWEAPGGVVVAAAAGPVGVLRGAGKEGANPRI